MKNVTRIELESKIELYLLFLKGDLERVRAMKDDDSIDYKYARLSSLHDHADALAMLADIYLSDTFEAEKGE